MVVPASTLEAVLILENGNLTHVPYMLGCPRGSCKNRSARQASAELRQGVSFTALIGMPGRKSAAQKSRDDGTPHWRRPLAMCRRGSRALERGAVSGVQGCPFHFNSSKVLRPAFADLLTLRVAGSSLCAGLSPQSLLLPGQGAIVSASLALRLPTCDGCGEWRAWVTKSIEFFGLELWPTSHRCIIVLRPLGVTSLCILVCPSAQQCRCLGTGLLATARVAMRKTPDSGLHWPGGDV